MMNRFVRQLRGNIVLMAGFMVPAIGASAIAGIEMSNTLKLERAAQKGIDVSVLGCAKDSTACNRGRFDAHMQDLPGYRAERAEVRVERDGTTGAVSGEAVIRAGRTLLGDSGLAAAVLPDVTIKVAANAIGASDEMLENGDETLNVSEIVLVLDLSWSISTVMLQEIKTSAKDFIDRVFDAGTPLVTIIPFAGSIRFPGGQGFESLIAADDGIAWSGCIAAQSETDIETVETPATGLSILDETRENWGGYAVCPPSNTTALMVEDNPETIKAHIDGLERAFGTASYTALSWGLRTVFADADSPLRGGKAYDGKGAAVILFSDGKPTASKKVNKNAGKNVLQRLCRKTNALGLDLYTAYFAPAGSNNEDARRSMERCAPDLDHFWTNLDADIQSAFEEIGDAITEQDHRVRLTN